MSEQAAISVIQTNASARGVLIKLILFSLALGLVPITSYYASLRYFWEGNTTFSAITAVVAANIVLVAYIVMSLLEDRQSNPSIPQMKRSETRKEK